MPIIRKLSNYLYTILIKGISAIFRDQMPTYVVFNKVHFMLA